MIIDATALIKGRSIYSGFSVYALVFILLVFNSCTLKTQSDNTSIGGKNELVNSKAIQDSIIKEHLELGAWTKGLYSIEWQKEIDKGLQKDSTIAYLWQQKAMPLFKQGKVTP